MVRLVEKQIRMPPLNAQESMYALGLNNSVQNFPNQNPMHDAIVSKPAVGGHDCISA